MLKKEEIVKCVLSFFYIGYLPAPGTIASIFPAWVFFLLKGNPLIYGALAIFFLIAALALSAEGEAIFKRKDPPEIVLDEVAGMFIAFIFIPFSLKYAILGFVVFRFFDIMKIYPIRSIERLPGGLGIVLDDICAAVYTNIILNSLIITRMV